MKELLKTRRAQVVIAVAMMICLLAMLVPHAEGHGTLLTYVLLPVFLFGLLDLPWSFRTPSQDSALFLEAPVLSALFQRPPPSLG